MRKILVIITLGLLLCNIGYAGHIFERLETEGHDNSYIQKICIDGYIFIRTGSYLGDYDTDFRTTTFTQFFKKEGGISLPARC